MPVKQAPRRGKRPTMPRNPNAAPTTISLDRDAKALLVSMCTSGTMGAFLSGLIRAEVARREERARLRHVLEEDPIGVTP